MSCKCGRGCGPIIVPTPDGAADTVACDQGQALLVSVCDSDESPTDEECRTTTSLLLADTPTDTDLHPDATLTDTDPSPYYWDDCTALAYISCLPEPDSAALWTGATVVYGPDPDTVNQIVHRWAAATIQADRPVCDDGVALLDISARVRLDGPTPGRAGNGYLALHEASGRQIARVPARRAAPVGYEDVLRIQVAVDAAMLEAAGYVVVLQLETQHDGEKAWTVSGFDVDVEVQACGCAVEFLRHITVDCDTGQVLVVEDTTVDGTAPYFVQGQTGAPCCDCTQYRPGDSTNVTVVGCDMVSTFEVCRCDDTTGDGQADTSYIELWGVPCDGQPPRLLFTFTDADPGVEYQPLAPMLCPDDEPESPS